MSEVAQDSLLSATWTTLFAHKRIVSVAEIVDTVGVELPNIVIVSHTEELASGTIGIETAAFCPVESKFGIHELVIQHKVRLAGLKVTTFERDHSVSNKLSLEQDGNNRIASVVLIDLHSEIRNILACIAFACQPEIIANVFSELPVTKEVHKSIQTVLSHQ